MAQYATSKLLTELLSVLDNFERALVTTPANPESEAFAKGVNMIFRQLDGVLKAEGLTAMETVGQPLILNTIRLLCRLRARSTKRVSLQKRFKRDIF